MQAIETLVLKAELECFGTNAAAPDKPFHFRHTLRYYQKQGRYRGELRIRSTQLKMPREYISLYDGQKYQLFEPTTGILSEASGAILPTGIMGLNPLLVPYLFLMPSAQVFEWSCLQDAALWRSQFPQGRWVEEAKEGNHTGAWVDFPCSQEPGATWRVFFAKELDYFPLKIRLLHSHKPERTAFVEVRDTILKENKGQRIVLPSQSVLYISDKNSNNINNITVIVEVDPDSLQINIPLSDQLFHIPETAAQRVFAVKPFSFAQDQQEASPVKPVYFQWLTIAAFIACSLLPLLFAWYIRRYRRRESSGGGNT